LESHGGIDKLVHEPARLVILSYLAFATSADFVFLMNETGLTKGNLSSHMSKLEDAGYVEVRKQFVGKIPQTQYSLTTVGRDAYNAYRDKMNGIIG
jgi:DNA-binding transcriptional ArsR family regulator